MKICCISDTHGQHDLLELPEADVLCHTGDFVKYGNTQELINFMNWFSKVGNFEHRLMIAGNHERLLEKSPSLFDTYAPLNITLLKDNSVVIDGIKFYGTPYQPYFCNWAFNLDEHKLLEKWEMIPEDVGVLLTHCPPSNILDRCMDGYHAGSKSLFIEILKRNPKAHIFGHIHEAYGAIKLYGGIQFVNSCIVNERYQVTNDPIVIEI